SGYRIKPQARRLASMLNKSVVEPWVRFTFGPSVPMPRYFADTEDALNQDLGLRIFELAGRLGIPLPVALFHEWFGTRQADGDEETITPAFSINVRSAEESFQQSLASMFAAEKE